MPGDHERLLWFPQDFVHHRWYFSCVLSLGALFDRGLQQLAIGLKETYYKAVTMHDDLSNLRSDLSAAEYRKMIKHIEHPVALALPPVTDRDVALVALAGNPLEVQNAQFGLQDSFHVCTPSFKYRIS